MGNDLDAVLKRCRVRFHQWWQVLDPEAATSSAVSAPQDLTADRLHIDGAIQPCYLAHRSGRLVEQLIHEGLGTLRREDRHDACEVLSVRPPARNGVACGIAQLAVAVGYVHVEGVNVGLALDLDPLAVLIQPPDATELLRSVPRPATGHDIGLVENEVGDVRIPGLFRFRSDARLYHGRKQCRAEVAASHSPVLALLVKTLSCLLVNDVVGGLYGLREGHIVHVRLAQEPFMILADAHHGR